MGPRAGRALDRPAHRRGGLRAGRRRRRAATTRSCSTSSATCSSRSTSSRCCSRSAAPAILADVAEHVPPEADPPPSARVRGDRGRPTRARCSRNWDRIKQGEDGREPGLFGEVPENLPGAALRPQGPAPRRLVRASTSRPRAPTTPSTASSRSSRPPAPTASAAFHEVGDVLFAAVNVARKLKVDPELALRAAADRFRGRVERRRAARADEGRSWKDLRPDEQLSFYAQARIDDGDLTPR